MPGGGTYFRDLRFEHARARVRLLRDKTVRYMYNISSVNTRSATNFRIFSTDTFSSVNVTPLSVHGTTYRINYRHFPLTNLPWLNAYAYLLRNGSLNVGRPASLRDRSCTFTNPSSRFSITYTRRTERRAITSLSLYLILSLKR